VANNVRPEQLAVLFVAISFTKTAGITRRPAPCRFARERKLHNFDGKSKLRACASVVAEARDLGLAERRPRHHHRSRAPWLSIGDRLCGDDAHRLGGMGEHHLAVTSPIRVDVSSTLCDRKGRYRWRRARSSAAGVLQAISRHARLEADRCRTRSAVNTSWTPS